MISRNDIFRLLDSFGVRHDDTLTIHASPRAPGPIEGGAVQYGRLGDAQVICCDARKAADVIMRVWRRATEDVCAREMVIPEAWYEGVMRNWQPLKTPTKRGK